MVFIDTAFHLHLHPASQVLRELWGSPDLFFGNNTHTIYRHKFLQDNCLWACSLNVPRHSTPTSCIYLPLHPSPEATPVPEQNCLGSSCTWYYWPDPPVLLSARLSACLDMASSPSPEFHPWPVCLPIHSPLRLLRRGQLLKLSTDFRPCSISGWKKKEESSRM